MIVAALRAAERSNAETFEQSTVPAVKRSRNASLLTAVPVALILLAAAVLFWRPVAAAFEANLGALAQARVELREYDYRHYADRVLRHVRQEVDLGRAQAYYRQALAIDPANATALTHLADIALDQKDYAGALALLQTAWEAGHRDRVTRLLYGDALVAAGRVDEGVQVQRGLRYAAIRQALHSEVFKLEGDTQRAQFAMAAADDLR
jgi:predicted Zn-dependent protease